jgi:hypothetical protein
LVVRSVYPARDVFLRTGHRAYVSSGFQLPISHWLHLRRAD